MQWSWQVVYFCICVLFSKSLWLCMDVEWCSPFQRILGLQWRWQSVLLVCDGQRWGSQGRSALVVKHTHTHSSSALLPTAGHWLYCKTWPRVSGNLVARKLPAASAPAANKMGTALVMPTNDWKMLIPRTAASLQRAFRKPNAVVLRKTRGGVAAAALINTSPF